MSAASKVGEGGYCQKDGRGECTEDLYNFQVVVVLERTIPRPS